MRPPGKIVFMYRGAEEKMVAEWSDPENFTWICPHKGMLTDHFPMSYTGAFVELLDDLHSTVPTGLSIYNLDLKTDVNSLTVIAREKSVDPLKLAGILTRRPNWYIQLVASLFTKKNEGLLISDVVEAGMKKSYTKKLLSNLLLPTEQVQLKFLIDGLYQHHKRMILIPLFSMSKEQLRKVRIEWSKHMKHGEEFIDIVRRYINADRKIGVEVDKLHEDFQVLLQANLEKFELKGENRVKLLKVLTERSQEHLKKLSENLAFRDSHTLEKAIENSLLKDSMKILLIGIYDPNLFYAKVFKHLFNSSNRLEFLVCFFSVLSKPKLKLIDDSYLACYGEKMELMIEKLAGKVFKLVCKTLLLLSYEEETMYDPELIEEWKRKPTEEMQDTPLEEVNARVSNMMEKEIREEKTDILEGERNPFDEGQLHKEVKRDIQLESLRLHSKRKLEDEQELSQALKENLFVAEHILGVKEGQNSNTTNNNLLKPKSNNGETIFQTDCENK